MLCAVGDLGSQAWIYSWHYVKLETLITKSSFFSINTKTHICKAYCNVIDQQTQLGLQQQQWDMQNLARSVVEYGIVTRVWRRKLNHFSHSLSVCNKVNWWRVLGYEIVQQRESRMQQDDIFSETFGFELEMMVCTVRDGTLIDQWQEKHRNVKFSYRSCLSSPLVCSCLKKIVTLGIFSKNFGWKTR